MRSSWVMVWTSRFTIFTTHVLQRRQNSKCTTTTTMSNFCRGERVSFWVVYSLRERRLYRVTPGNQNDMRHLIDTFNCVEDCPIFSDMYDFCRMYAGASLAGARKLCAGACDTAINWSGGLHHAKRGEASGFCYVNDIVLAILELLR